MGGYPRLRLIKYKSDDVRKTIARDFIRPDERFKCTEEYYDDFGMLMLCQHGCANDDYLIVTGEERGFVWGYLEWVGHQLPKLKECPKLPAAKLSDDERDAAEREWVRMILAATALEKCKFSDWYTKWLNEPPYILSNAKKKQTSTKLKSWFNFLKYS